jgi:hypothetical protein
LRTPRICLAVPFWPLDAIGNDVLGVREYLIRADYDVTILATWMDKGYERYARHLNLNDPILRSRNTILIYHHSIRWQERERLIESTNARVVIRYHNVTPPHFFDGYDQHYFDECTLGRASTERLAVERIVGPKLNIALGTLHLQPEHLRHTVGMIGAMPPSAPSLRARFGAVLIVLIRRALLWFIPPLKSAHETALSALEAQSRLRHINDLIHAARKDSE